MNVFGSITLGFTNLAEASDRLAVVHDVSMATKWANHRHARARGRGSCCCDGEALEPALCEFPAVHNQLLMWHSLRLSLYSQWLGCMAGLLLVHLDIHMML